MIWSIDGKSQKVSHSYDDLGRHTTVWSGEASTGTKLAEWAYDSVAKGQPASSTRYVGTQTYTQSITAYDDDYHATTSKITIPAGEGNLAREYAYTSTYDAAGNLREQTLPAAGGLPAEKLTHTYTDLGFVKGLTSDLGFTYLKDTSLTPTGQLAGRQLGANGQIKRTLERDASTDWLSKVTTQTKADTSSPQTVQDDRYSYDLGGQITRVLDAASAIAGSTDGQSECFTYDGLHRLKTAYTTTASTCTGTGDGLGIDAYNQAYTHDKVGNLTSLTDNGQTATYTYPTPGTSAVRPNAVTSITRPSGTDSYTYDNNGQLTARTVANKQGTFDWNELGQLVTATIDGKQTSMIYDANGNRLIRRDPDGTSTLYLPGTELKLSSGQVAGKRYYTSADGTQIAMRDAAGVTWLMSGSHGSTQLAINDTTGTVSRERYLPYGQRRGGDDLPFTDLGFLGKIEDAATGLDYLGARYYDPTIAKFISTDPELDPRKPEWANPYSYAGNNPIGLSDPDGLRVDAGGGTDPDAGRKANKTFDKTHWVSGQKKTKWDKKLERRNKKAVAAQERKMAARKAARDRLLGKDRQLDKRDPYTCKEKGRCDNGEATPDGLIGEGEGRIETLLCSRVTFGVCGAAVEGAKALKSGGIPVIGPAPKFDRRSHYYNMPTKARKNAIERQPSCPYCGQRPSTQADHINPVKKDFESGGWSDSKRERSDRVNDSDNLIGACQPCNGSKGAKEIGPGAGQWWPPGWPTGVWWPFGGP